VDEGGVNGAVFEASISSGDAPAHAPTLKEGDVVVMDDLSVPKSERVGESIESAGAKVLYLPRPTPRRSTTP
jgi:transposase